MRKARRGSTRPLRRILILVQNLPVPFDRRVWLEANALRDAGFQVSIVCPKGPGDRRTRSSRESASGRYPPPPEATGTISYAWEFAYCWLRTLVLVLRTAGREGVDVIQACNPPDTYWALALPFKLFGRRFVFDQHDLCPEVYESRFPDGSGSCIAALRLLERATYATSDHVIATNETYRETADRARRRGPERVTVVRTGRTPIVCGVELPSHAGGTAGGISAPTSA